MKSYKITKGILDELFSNDAEYMNDMSQLSVMNTKGIYDRLKSRHTSLEVTAILGLVQDVNGRLPEGYTADYAQVKRWLARQYPEGGLKDTIEYLKSYQKEEGLQMKTVEYDYCDVWFYKGYEIVKFTDADDLQVSSKEGNVIGRADSLQDATSFIDDHIKF